MITVKAERVHVVGIDGLIKAQKLSLRTEDGLILASADSADVLAPVPWGDKPRWYVSISGLNAEIERNPDGRWSFESLLPLRKEEKPTTAIFSVHVKNSRLTLSDRVGNWKQPLVTEIHSLAVSGAYQSFAARLEANLNGLGEIQTNAVLSGGKLKFFQGTTPSLNIGVIRKILGSLKETRDRTWVKNWDVSTGSFSGSAMWESASGEFQGHGRAEATNIRLDNDRFSSGVFVGRFSNKKMTGEFAVQGSGAKAKGIGEIELSPKVRVSLNGEILAQSLSSATKYLHGIELPKGLDFSTAMFRGRMEYSDYLSAFGNLSASRISYGNYQSSNSSAQLVITKDRIRLGNIKGVVRDSQVRGEASFEIGGSNTVNAFFRADDISLSHFPNLPKKYVLGGRVDVAAVIDGKISHPNISFDVSGDTRLLLQTEDETIVESAEVNGRATLENGKLQVSAFEFSGASGSARGSGSYDLDSSELDFRLVANNVRLKALPESPADGTGYADVKVTGTLNNPKIEGKVEIYAASIGDYSLPFASGFAKYGGDRLRVDDLTVRSGVSLATGALDIGLTNGSSIVGSGQIIDFGLDFLQDARLQGLAEGKWSVGGSLDDPIGHVQLHGNSLFVDKVLAKDVSLEIDANKTAIDIREFKATVGNGLFVASGSFPFSGEGQINVTATDVDADVFSAYDESSIPYQGSLSLSGSLSFVDAKPVSGVFESNFKDISINNVWIGPGKVTATYKDDRLLAEGFTSNIDRNLLLESGSYDFNSKQIGGTFSAIRADIGSLILFGDSYVQKWTPEQQEQIRKLSGDLSTVIQFGGTTDNPLIDTSVSTDSLSYDNKSIGKISVTGKMDNDRWTISAANWTGGPALASLNPKSNNYIEQDGTLNLDGEITNIRLEEFAQFFPAADGLIGTLDLYFNASGQTKSPLTIASISGSGVGTKEFALSSLNFERIEIRDGSISTNSNSKEGAKAQVSYKGFNAEISNLNIPFRYPFEILRSEPISARVDVPSRDVDSLSELFGGLDTSVSEGQLNNAVLEVSGSIDSLSVVGNVTANFQKLKFRDFDPIFTIPEASLQLLPNEIMDVKIGGSSSQGGTFNLNAKVDLSEKSILEGSQILANAFTMRDQIADGVSVGGQLSFENMKIVGPLEAPIIGGRNSKVVINNGNLVLDGDLPESSPPSALPINPVFDISKIDIQSARVKSGSLTSNVVGTGSLKGTLEQPDANLDFILKSGDVTLPTSRIRLQPEGTASLSFSRNWDGVTKAVLDVSLKGTTQANAFNGLTVQRYRILLNITGDALSQEGLRIDAESDPPGLTQDEILALIGQLRVLESIAGVSRGNQGNRFEDILTLAAPAIFAPITRGLEAGLGLDYVLLDFGRGGIGSFTIGKSLGMGFTIEYRGPLGDTTRELGSLEQLVLTYRPVSSNPLLRQLSLSAILERPGLLKLSFGYSGRF